MFTILFAATFALVFVAVAVSAIASVASVSRI
jgi:hypothetical protein